MIHHVTRRVPPAHLQTCLAFYGRLGFSEVDPPPSLADRARWLELAGVQLHLMPDPAAIPESGHIAIVPDDYDATVLSLQNAGFTVEPRTEHWGARRSYVRDPAGNTVELMASAPAA